MGGEGGGARGTSSIQSMEVAAEVEDWGTSGRSCGLSITQVFQYSDIQVSLVFRARRLRIKEPVDGALVQVYHSVFSIPSIPVSLVFRARSLRIGEPVDGALVGGSS